MLLRLLALALIVAISFTILLATADAGFSGTFDDTTSVADLDDDFAEVLRLPLSFAAVFEPDPQHFPLAPPEPPAHPRLRSERNTQWPA